ncbi:MAG: GNAT family N-acetyltransferase [Woeseiaceae bacterium]|nr:GNAT family N-acetyltransferase [Woeseiaceae bacterium]
MQDVVTVRPVERSDAGAIADMIRALGRAIGEEHKVTSRATDFARHGFGPRPAFHGLLAERAGAPVGLALWCYVFSSWRGEPGAYLQDLYVAESERGTGLGRRLLAAVAAGARADGANHLRLSVATDNEPARAFYAHTGSTYRDDECIYQVADADFTALAAAHDSRDDAR